MAKDSSFDVVSQINLNEVRNAVQQASRELSQRYDLKNSDSSIQFDDKAPALTVTSRDEFTLNAVLDLLKQRLVRRKVSLKGLRPGRIEPAAGGAVRQVLDVQQGIPQDTCKDIVKTVKTAKLKVQASIQGDQVRISSKSRDALQQVIALLKGEEFGLDLQFVNYR
jgi:uncharacterized protein YajQ (UPF0234 family)